LDNIRYVRKSLLTARCIFIYQTQVRRLAFYVANTVFSSRQTPAISAFFWSLPTILYCVQF